MRGRRSLHRFVAKLLIELRRRRGIGAKPKEGVAALGTGLELRYQRASDSGAAMLTPDVEVAKAAHAWIPQVRIGRDAADADELIMGRDAEEKLTRIVKTDSSSREIVDEPSDEPIAFGLTNNR